MICQIKQIKMRFYSWTQPLCLVVETQTWEGDAVNTTGMPQVCEGLL